MNLKILNSPHTALPITHLISNSHLSLMIDNAGSGFSTLDREIALTRWKEDVALNNYGYYFFVRDLEAKKIWSTTYQPTCVEPEQYSVIFSEGKAVFKRQDYDILIHTEITISQKDNVEIRKISFSNLSKKRRSLDITSYGEVMINSVKADNAHPAFSKMFVESEYIQDLNGLLFSRRPRSKKESRMYFFHGLIRDKINDKINFETSRLDFMGRCNTIKNPQGMNFDQDLKGNVGYVLDPLFSLRTKLDLAPGQTETVAYINVASKDKKELLSIVHRYKDMQQITGDLEQQSKKEATKQAEAFQKLGNILLFNQDKFRAKSKLIAQNRLAQPTLWSLGISGDLPILLLCITKPDQIKIVTELLTAHSYLRTHGLVFDLVIANEYSEKFQDELELIVKSSCSTDLINNNGGVFLRSTSQMTIKQRDLLQVVARAVINGSKGSLISQLKFDDFEQLRDQYRNQPDKAKSHQKTKFNHKKCEFFNGIGGFIDNAETYRIYIENGKFPPLPWSNIIANPHFGTIMTESGAGFTWSDNSRENRLSTWSNDPVNDPLSEILYVRDVGTSKYWSLTPRPVVAEADFIVDHSYAESTFQTEIEGIQSKLTVSITEKEKFKIWQIDFKNQDTKTKELELFLYVEWVLGVSREDTARFIFSAFDTEAEVLYAGNYYNVDFPGRFVALGSSEDIESFTTERVEFLGRNGNKAEPFTFLAKNIKPGVDVNLNNKASTGSDSCGVIKVKVMLAPDESKTVKFFMTESPSLKELKKSCLKLNFFEGKNTLNDFYKKINRTIKVKTPDQSFNILINSWLLYQTLSCRLFARSGYYQSGGAIGFRDQLQDVLALVHSRPDLTRAQILIHASRQFLEGDVQHWWHPPSGKGVRTKISDDYLFLPFVTCNYLTATGDYSILDEKVGFISGPILEENQHENYMVPQIADSTATIYEHCLLALERGNRLGQHGLPLMGTGDWNDGMNEVGIEGKGESVWLAWFYIDVLNQFAVITEYKKDKERTDKYKKLAKRIHKSIEENAWDGKWYRRAYFDDGTPLGSAENDECKIDSLSQSWGVISGAADKNRAIKAMNQVVERLVKKEDRVVCLLQPAFNEGILEPGYIKGYLPGIRENGGQYTHAAAWTVIAEALLGNGTLAAELFSLINPINHTKDPRGVQKYKGEPYVLCGDVYSVSPHEGRAGWSWYTGAAGWMYKAGVEYLIGLKILPDHFTVTPCIPSSWKEYSIELNKKGTLYKISIINPEGLEKGNIEVFVGGEKIEDGKIRYENFKGQITVDVKIKMNLPE